VPSRNVADYDAGWAINMQFPVSWHVETTLVYQQPRWHMLLQQ